MSRHNNINNNVVQQQQPRSVGSDLIYTNEWSQGICGCGNHCGICACVAFCLPCYTCYLHSKAKECCATPFFCPNSLLGLRAKIRAHYNIAGSLWEDACCLSFCCCCVICQLASELKAQGIDI